MTISYMINYEETEIRIDSNSYDLSINQILKLDGIPCKDCLVQPACMKYDWSSKCKGDHVVPFRYIRVKKCSELLKFLEESTVFQMWVPYLGFHTELYQMGDW